MHRLLLIEPSPAVAAPIRAYLEHHEFTVDVVDELDDARGYDMKRYAVIIVDLRRTDRDSLLFVQWLHQVHSFLLGRVVVMSADESDALAHDLSNLGVCDILPKPINANEILRAVRECLEKSPEFAVH
jgi:DNA-binding response OmpR family regulator